MKTEKIFGPRLNDVNAITDDLTYWVPNTNIFRYAVGDGGTNDGPTDGSDFSGGDPGFDGGYDGGEGDWSGGGGNFGGGGGKDGPGDGGPDFGGDQFGDGGREDDDEGDKTGGGGGGGTQPVAGEEDDDSGLQDFLDALGKYNTQFLEAGFTGMGQGTLDAATSQTQNIINQLSGIKPAGLPQAQAQSQNIASTLQNIGMGAADPRFEQFRQAQLNLLENQRQGEAARASEALSRRGLGGTAAEQNVAASISDRYNRQAQAMSGQLGLQSLGRQDASLQNALGAYGQSANLGMSGAQLQSSLLGQQAGLGQQNFANTLAQIQSANQARGMNLEALTAGLQNLTIPFSLETARIAAENLGKDTDDDGGIFNLFNF